MAYEGFSARHIASRLGLSESGARGLVQDAFAELGVEDRKELREKWIEEMWELTSTGLDVSLRSTATQ